MEQKGIFLFIKKYIIYSEDDFYVLNNRASESMKYKK